MSERAIITDKIVVARTGATVEEWFRHLDDLGARTKTHAEIFEIVASTDGLKPLGEWNHNLLTTSYEWDRGLKERGQKADGFEISISKTVNVPLAVLFASFAESGRRKQWLDADLEITKQTENKSVRGVWSDGVTRLSVDFYDKGGEKSQIVVQHMKIPDSEMAATMKEFWGARLHDLKAYLESSGADHATP